MLLFIFVANENQALSKQTVKSIFSLSMLASEGSCSHAVNTYMQLNMLSKNYTSYVAKFKYGCLSFMNVLVLVATFH